jgi:hypothetical protein
VDIFAIVYAPVTMNTPSNTTVSAAELINVTGINKNSVAMKV